MNSVICVHVRLCMWENWYCDSSTEESDMNQSKNWAETILASTAWRLLGCRQAIPQPADRFKFCCDCVFWWS